MNVNKNQRLFERVHFWTNADGTRFGVHLKYPTWESFSHLIGKNSKSKMYPFKKSLIFDLIHLKIARKLSHNVPWKMYYLWLFSNQMAKSFPLRVFQNKPISSMSSICSKMFHLKSLWFLIADISDLVQLCPTMSHALCTAIDFFPIKWEKLSHEEYFKLSINPKSGSKMYPFKKSQVFVRIHFRLGTNLSHNVPQTGASLRHIFRVGQNPNLVFLLNQPNFCLWFPPFFC